MARASLCCFNCLTRTRKYWWSRSAGTHSWCRRSHRAERRGACCFGTFEDAEQDAQSAGGNIIFLVHVWQI